MQLATIPLYNPVVFILEIGKPCMLPTLLQFSELTEHGTCSLLQLVAAHIIGENN